MKFAKSLKYGLRSYRNVVLQNYGNEVLQICVNRICKVLKMKFVRYKKEVF